MDVPEFRALIEDLVINHEEINDATFWDRTTDWFLEVLASRAGARRPDPMPSVVRPSSSVLEGAAEAYESVPGYDRHRSNPEVHYRLYRGRDGKATVICVQDFDYMDYDSTRFLSPIAWDSESEAMGALVGFNAGMASVAGWPKLYS